MQLLLDGKNFHADFMYATDITLYVITQRAPYISAFKTAEIVYKKKIEHHND